MYEINLYELKLFLPSAFDVVTALVLLGTRYNWLVVHKVDERARPEAFESILMSSSFLMVNDPEAASRRLGYRISQSEILFWTSSFNLSLKIW